MEATTKLFAEVQSAYEILSDPQERAWYDSHRSEILRGDDEGRGNHYEHDVRITTTEDIMRAFPKINANRDFSQASSSFYNTVRTIFDTLAKEEELACEWENLDPISYPGFGDVEDKYDPTVRSFYTVWSNFATRKAFSWVDIYRYSEAPDRRVRRLMEKENRRLRDEAIREFNDAVRSLVAFVKKRDPRFKPTVQSEAERQKVLKDAASAQAARSRAANKAKAEASTVSPQWAQQEEPELREESDIPEETPKETYECVLCNKFFKSEKQFEAHERSKKHFKAAQQIRKEMQYQERDLDLAQQTPKEPSLRSESPPKGILFDGLRGSVEGLSVNDVASANEEDSAHDGDCDATPTRKGHREPAADASDDEYADRKDVEQRILGQQKHDEPSAAINGHAEQASAVDLSEHHDPTPRKIGKAKAKRAKKAAQKPTTSATAETQFKCSMCGAGFPSKTKLFNHINELGHAQPVTKGTNGSKGRSK